MPGELTPFAILVAYFAAVVVLILAMLGLSYVLGERHEERATADPFESGVLPVASARMALPAKFYLVALLFVIFDLEAVFIIAWAIAAREVGWAGYAEVAVFVAVLVAALAYLWRIGALEWGPHGRRSSPPPGHWTRPESAGERRESATQESAP